MKIFQPTSEKKLLLIGLGNPGKEYDLTRHNAGYLFLDEIISIMSEKKAGSEKKSTHDMLLQTFPATGLMLLKPLTYMNRSGVAAKAIVKNTNIRHDQILLVHDDLDIKFGKYKLQLEKSPREHKGVKSVEQELGFKDFWRLRIGIDNRTDKKISGEAYVLQKFTHDERKLLAEEFTLILKQHFTFS